MIKKNQKGGGMKMQKGKAIGDWVIGKLGGKKKRSKEKRWQVKKMTAKLVLLKIVKDS